MPEDNDQVEEMTTDEAVQAALAYEAQRRMWLRQLTRILRLRSTESDPSDRVQYALDMAAIAACDRIARICRSDLPADAA